MTDGGGSHLISTVYGGDDDEESSSALLSHTQLERNKEEEEEDIQPINGVADFAGIFLTESKKLWYLAAPAIFTSFCQYGLITITQIFAGHLGTTQLAAVSVQNSIISGFPFGMMFGMSSALEAYGANQHELLGIYMQKSWIILTSMAVAALPLFISADDVLLPGNKYFIIRSTTVEKLKRRHERKSRGDCDEIEEVSVCCSSGEFFVPEENWSVLRKHAKGKGKEKRQFVPPIQRPRIWREHEWEPSLNSIQEVSP